MVNKSLSNCICERQPACGRESGCYSAYRAGWVLLVLLLLLLLLLLLTVPPHAAECRHQSQ